MARMPCRTSYAVQMRDAIKELTGEALDAFEAGQHGNTRWTLRTLLVSCTLMGDTPKLKRSESVGAAA